MKRIATILLSAFLSLSAISAEALALPALLLPGLLYDEAVESRSYDLSDIDPEEIKPLFAAPLLRDSGIRASDLVAGSEEEIAYAMLGLIFSFFPLEMIDPIEGSGTVTITPYLSSGDLSGGVIISYDEVEALSSDGTGFSCTGTVDASMRIGTDDGFISACIMPDDLILCGKKIEGGLGLTLGIDGKAVRRALKWAGVDTDSYRYILASEIADGIDGKEKKELEALLGAEEGLTPEGMLSMIEGYGMMDAMDFVILCISSSDHGIPYEEILSALILKVSEDGMEVQADLPAIIGAMEAMDSL